MKSSEKSKQLLASIVESKAEIKRIKTELNKKLKDYFHGMAKELFQAYPELKSFGWTQYTPFFNDGEPCVFSSNHDYPTINGNDENSGNNEQEEGVIDIVSDSEETRCDSSTDWKYVPNETYNPYYGEIVTTLKEFLNLFDDDDMKGLFDNHVTVTITEEGSFTEEYDHG